MRLVTGHMLCDTIVLPTPIATGQIMSESLEEPVTNPFTHCTGAEPGDGCEGDFPNKDHEGLCARCLMLERYENDPAEREIRAVSSSAVFLTCLSLKDY